MTASRRHWQVLIGTVLVLLASAFLAPSFIPEPGIAENRILAQRPDLPQHLSQISGFMEGADAYVADQFPARPYLIAGFNRLRMLAGVSGSDSVLVGKDGWLFYDNGSHLGAARNDPPITEPEVRAWLQALAGRTEMLQARGVTYLVVVPPLKEVIYPEQAPRWFAGPDPQRAAVTLSTLAEVADVGEVLYLQAPLAEARERGWKTFSRHDTHWTGYGAYSGYEALMARLSQIGAADAPLPITAFDDIKLEARRSPADLALMLGVAGFVAVDYPSIDNLDGWAQAKTSYLTDKTDWTAPQIIDTGRTGKPVLLMSRDSFSNALLPMLLPHFSRIILTHVQDGFWRPDLIDRFAPDVVLLEVLESGVRSASGEGPPASPEALARIEEVIRKATPAPPMTPAPAALVASIDQAVIASACNLEAVTFEAAPMEGSVLTVAGWFAVPSDWGSPPEGWARLQGPGGDFVAQIAADQPRPDVAAYLKDVRGERSGFYGRYELPELSGEGYTASIYRRANGGWEVCRSPAALARAAR
ncbi:hypothetical protein [Phenylobacterium sp.]|uniref:alginate O-acetyltransferase AlgX-related protein n=1 Tax=Phenylobacterium sp. TaxID=1871053 RepID=UPI002618D33E|nr:hypothetical protein [Phenylobacterium sp.]